MEPSDDRVPLEDKISLESYDLELPLEKCENTAEGDHLGMLALP